MENLWIVIALGEKLNDVRNVFKIWKTYSFLSRLISINNSPGLNLIRLLYAFHDALHTIRDNLLRLRNCDGNGTRDRGHY